MFTENAGYYRARASEERDCAAKAIDTSIAAIHLTLAERYELLAQKAEAGGHVTEGWKGMFFPSRA